MNSTTADFFSLQYNQSISYWTPIQLTSSHCNTINQSINQLLKSTTADFFSLQYNQSINQSISCWTPLQPTSSHCNTVNQSINQLMNSTTADFFSLKYNKKIYQIFLKIHQELSWAGDNSRFFALVAKNLHCRQQNRLLCGRWFLSKDCLYTYIFLNSTLDLLYVTIFYWHYQKLIKYANTGSKKSSAVK